MKNSYEHIFELKRHLKTGAGDKSLSDEIVVEAVKPNHIDLNVDLLETCDDCAKNVSLLSRKLCKLFVFQDSFDCGGRRNTFECGVCKCDMGTDEDPNLNRDCQRMGDNPDKFYSLPCNGAGSCRCGKCFCNENRIGDQCQCNALFCGKLQSFYLEPFYSLCSLSDHKSSLGMNGKCGNGKCIHEIDPDTGSCKMSCDCEPGKVSYTLAIFVIFAIFAYLQYFDRNIRLKVNTEKGFTIDRTTKMCSCSTETENCISENGKQCGGKKQGHCNCNKCECNELYTTFDDEGKFSD